MPRKYGSSSGCRRSKFNLFLGNARLCLGVETKIMGVLNVTPDSFSDGGSFLDPGRAEARALEIEREGAHLLDIGAESTRPGSVGISAHEEIGRLRPVLRRLSKKIKIPLSVDTMKDDVARFALDEGACLVNDVSGLRSGGATLAKRIARCRAGVVLMHMRGTPQTMQRQVRYKDLIGDICRELRRSCETALEAGILKSSVIIDPGFGFSKTADQNIELLAKLGGLARMRFPVLVGLSRKSFIGHATGAPVSERLYGSLGAAAMAIERGAHIVRVHDVAAHVQLSRLTDKLMREGGSCT